MNLKIISSGSVGNAYILEAKDAAILIECGVRFDEIKKAIDFKVSKIDACLITHEHKDHCKSASSVFGNGIPIVASAGTFDALKTPPELRTYQLKHAETITISNKWKIYALAAEHDAKEPLSFIIESEEVGRVLFITDSYIFKYNIPKVDHLIIEANFDEKIVEEIQKSRPDYVNKRRFRSHMSFQTTLKTIERMDRSSLKNIVLIHLSDQVSNERQFKEITEAEFGIQTTIATKNQIINFSKSKF